MNDKIYVSYLNTNDEISTLEYTVICEEEDTVFFKRTGDFKVLFKDKYCVYNTLVDFIKSNATTISSLESYENICTWEKPDISDNELKSYIKILWENEITEEIEDIDNKIKGLEKQKREYELKLESIKRNKE